MPDAKIAPRDMRPFLRDLPCGADGCSGTLRPTGVVLCADPATYLHRCDSCGAGWRSGYYWPYILYVPAEETCTWTQGPAWTTACGHEFTYVLEEALARDVARLNFCCYCGRRLESVESDDA